jgi:dipeptidyl aminopeptidase/acylaminoacyl peptidase
VRNWAALTKAILIWLTVLAAFARQPFTPADYWAWRTADEPQISADGRWVVYSEGWRDRESNASHSNLWIVSASGSERRPFTKGAWTDHSPRWSPDQSRIAWLSDREGVTRIFVRGLNEERESEVPVPGTSPMSLAWSPDGRWLAFTAELPAKAAVPWAPAALLPFLSTGTPHSCVEIFIAPSTGGAPRRLTHDSFVRRGAPVWTPDGQWILNSAERAFNAAKPLEGAEIYGIHVTEGLVRRLTEHPGPDEDPLPAPDGSKIAWIRAEDKPAAYAVRKIWVMSVDAKRTKALTGTLDRDAASPQWSSDSRTVYFLADDRGATHVYAARNDGTVRQVVNRAERLRGFSLADNGRAVTVRSSANQAGDVVSFAVDLPGGVTTLASPNNALLAEHDIGMREEIHFTSDGKDMQGWLVKPPNADPAKTYPLLVDVDSEGESGNSAHAMAGVEFSLRAQILAARGWMVLTLNPRGTSGYGEVFGNLLRTRFPGDDFDDVMRGVDAAIGRGGIDAHRVALSGGLLAAWAIGHTDRFATVVVRRPIADWASAVALAPAGSRRAAWMGALPWEEPDQYTRHSPLFFAGNFKTPTLVMGDDVQSRELYFALEARHVESALARLANDPKPATRVLELEAELAWLERWLGAPAAAGN